MGASHNPSGKAQATDDEVKDALRKALEDSDDDRLAVGASAVADLLPIGQPATKKRLDKLMQEDHGVKRFRGPHSYLYYPAEVADSSPVLQTATPPTAAAGAADETSRSYLSWALSKVLNEPVAESRAWLDHPRSRLETSPLFYLAIPFIVELLIAGGITYAFTGDSVLSVTVGVLAGLTATVLFGAYVLYNIYTRTHPET